MKTRFFSLFRMTVVGLLVIWNLMLSASPAYAIGAGLSCDPTNDQCDSRLTCQKATADTAITTTGEYYCFSAPDSENSSTTTTTDNESEVNKVFGKITPPGPVQQFLNKGGEGSNGISFFLTNLVILIYVIASVIFVFMIIFGAVQWIVSGGNKDSVANARNRIIHAIIGIVILGVAFAIIQLVGQFTGFTFFDQKEQYYYDQNTQECIFKRCPTGQDKPGECTFTPVEMSKCRQ